MSMPLAPAVTEAPAAPPRYELFSGGAVLLASFLGSPLAGCVLMAINDRRLGRPREAVKILAGGVVGTAVLLAIAYALPDDLHLNSLGWLVALAIKPVYDKHQGPLFAAHEKAGGAKASAWVAAGVGIAALVGVLAIIFGVVLLGPSSYGTELDFGQSQLYYGEGVTAAQAKAMSGALLARDLGGDKALAFRLTRHGAGYALGLVMNDGAWSKPDIREGMREVGEHLHHVFEPRSPLAMQLCADDFEVKSTIAPDELRAFVEEGKVDAFFTRGATEADARKLLAALRGAGIVDKDSAMDLEVRRQGATYVVSFPMKAGAWDQPETRKSFRGIGDTLSTGAFGGAPVDVRLCDGTWHVHTTLPAKG